MDARNSSDHSSGSEDEQPTNSNSTYSYLSSLFFGSGATTHLPQQLLINAELDDSQIINTQTIPSEEVDKALKTAGESKPGVIKVLNHPNSRLNICVLGCQGDKRPIYQTQVAQLINEKASEFPELKPDLFIILGDNFYPDGVPDPTDPRFEKQFHEVYGNPELKNICGNPCIVILGNHDAGRDKETLIKSYIPGHNLLSITSTNPLNHDKAEMQQIAHSYLPHPSDPTMTDKREFFQRESVNYGELPKHIMPHYFHSWIFDELQVFALNSNSYVKDYLTLLRNYASDEPTDPTTNQAAWVQKEYQEAERCKRATMFTMHHPLFSAGKRVYEKGWDAYHYLSAEEITLLNHILQLSPDAVDFKESLKAIFSESYTHLATNANYNEMLTKIIYTFQKMSPDMVCTAHDHSNYYYNNKNDMTTTAPKICQVVAGGGGSKDLQDRYYFGNYDNIGGFLRQHGFSIISCDKTHPEFFEINTFTTSGRHLQFTSQSSTPIRDPETDERVRIIRNIVLEACKKYMDFLNESQQTYKGQFFEYLPSGKSKPKKLLSMLYSPVASCVYNLTHTHGDVDIMHDMMNYLNQPIPSSYDDTISFLFTSMSNLFNREHDHSLYMDINEQIQKAFEGRSISMLFFEAARTNHFKEYYSL